jgi:mannose-6-phosphate isomerase
VDLLAGRLQHYDWGSFTALADLRGVEPSGKPEAELWFGTHRPGSAGSGPGPDEEYLPDDQQDQPGQRDLPYLVKLLAADRPLSLQAHPDARAAADGCRREEEAGLAPDDPARSFPDPGPKPELLCAITRFEALCGFRPVPEALEVARALGVPARLLALLDGAGPDAWCHLVGTALSGDGGDGDGRDVARLVEVARTVLEGGEPATGDRTGHETFGGQGEAGAVARAAEVVCRLADRYPDDPALLLVPMLRPLVLQPGEAMFVGPGVLHAYLGGMALEVMTPCDNVVRGGFTSKHVDTGALVDLLDPGEAPGVQRSVEGVHRYEVPVSDFAVWRIEGLHEIQVGTDPVAGTGAEAGADAEVVGAAGSGITAGGRPGPDVVVAIAGRTVVGDDLVLAPGEAALVPAADGAYRISVDGIAHRISVGG